MLKHRFLMDRAGESGGGGAIAEIRAPRIEVKADSGDGVRDLAEWSASITNYINEQMRRAKDGKVADPEVLHRLDQEMQKFGPATQRVHAFIEANASRFTSSDTEAVVLRKANLRLQPGDDLKGVNRTMLNLVALTPDEVTGIAGFGRGVSSARRVSRLTGNQELARSRSLVEEFQELNDMLLFKDRILAFKNQAYRELGPPAVRMQTLREWSDFAKIGEDLFRAIGEATGAAGNYLVPVVLSSQMGGMVEAEAKVAALFPRITMTSKTYEWPFQRTRSTAYHVEDNDPVSDDPATDLLTASQFSIGKPVWNAQRLADFIYVADDVDEDGIESAVQVAMNDSAVVLARATEDGIINGQFKASTMDGSTFNPAKSSKRWTNGLRYHALMTASYPAVSAVGGALTFANILTVLEKMGPWGIGAPVADTVFITGAIGLRNLFLLAAGDTRYFQTVGQTGPGAALVTGQVGDVLGRPVVYSDFVPATHTDGKVSATAANNVKGSILVVNRRRYAIGDRKATQIEESRHAAFRKFQTAIRASVRIDFESMDSDIAAPRELITGATPVGLIYSIN